MGSGCSNVGTSGAEVTDGNIIEVEGAVFIVGVVDNFGIGVDKEPVPKKSILGSQKTSNTQKLTERKVVDSWFHLECCRLGCRFL